MKPLKTIRVCADPCPSDVRTCVLAPGHGGPDHSDGKHTFWPNNVPCATCGAATPMRGTRRCDGCWEVEHRLAQYLETGPNARNFVRHALRLATEKIEPAKGGE